MDEKNERKEGYWMDGLIDRLMKRKKMDGKKDDEWGGWTDEKDGWKEESKKRKMNG